jgi:phage terminase large subunit GpA-like protein
MASKITTALVAALVVGALMTPNHEALARGGGNAIEQHGALLNGGRSRRRTSTRSHTRSCRVLGSTPLVEETSHVCKAYAASDMRVFEVPCPACGAFTEIKWAHIEWPPGEP